MITDLPDERWRPVPGYEDIYEVSNCGRVKSLERTVDVTRRWGVQSQRLPERVMRLKASWRGLYVDLRLDGLRTQFRVSRLVAEAFLGECPAGHQVMQIDGDPANAAVSNLRYATRAEIENAKIGRGTAPTGEDSHRAKLSNAEARYIRRNPDGLPQADLATQFGVSPSSVCTLTSGKHWKYLGHGEAAGCRLPDPFPDSAPVTAVAPSAPSGRLVETPPPGDGARGRKPETPAP